MPFTFLPHQAPVLPLLGRPGRQRWAVDGVAMVVGTMVPDLAYVLSGTGLAFDSHALVAQVWYGVPLAVLLATLFRRRVAAPLAANLPDGGLLHLRDFGTVAVRRPTLTASVVGAAIGAVSHVLLDSPTHNDGWMTRHIWFLRWQRDRHRRALVPPDAVLQYVVSLIGAAFTLGWLWWAGRQRLLLADGVEPPPLVATPTSRRRLWGTTAAFGAVGLVVMVATRHVGSPVAGFIRCSVLVLAGLGLGSVWAGQASLGGGERPGHLPLGGQRHVEEQLVGVVRGPGPACRPEAVDQPGGDRHGRVAVDVGDDRERAHVHEVGESRRCRRRAAQVGSFGNAPDERAHRRHAPRGTPSGRRRWPSRRR